MKTMHTKKAAADSKYRLRTAPVRSYGAPGYPTLEQSRSDPSLLERLPPSWYKKAAVVTAAAAAAGILGTAALTSCALREVEPGADTAAGYSPAGSGISTAGNDGGEAPVSSDNPDGLGTDIPAAGDGGGDARAAGYNPDSENFLSVAPVFVHGEGTGSMGCVMVVPPVFMSEQEALEIIKNAAAAAGISFGNEPPAYTATSNEGENQGAVSSGKYTLGEGSVALDLFDGEKNVAAAFVSMTEAREKQDGFYLSVSYYKPRELAELSAADFAGQRGDISVGLFYDPGNSDEYGRNLLSEYNQKTREINEQYRIDGIKTAYDKSREDARNEYEESVKKHQEELLTAQVNDFLEWLRGQGII